MDKQQQGKRTNGHTYRQTGGGGGGERDRDRSIETDRDRETERIHRQSATRRRLLVPVFIEMPAKEDSAGNGKLTTVLKL